MRRTIIILVIIFFAGTAYSSEPYPTKYFCQHKASRPAEAEFCELFHAQLVLSGMVDFKFDSDRPYFMIIVLPTARDG